GWRGGGGRAAGAGGERGGGAPARDDPDVEGAEAAACDQAVEGRERVREVGEQARVDDPRGGTGDPAGAPPDGPARRRPLRDERPERPLPAGGPTPQTPEEGAPPPGAPGPSPTPKTPAPTRPRRPLRPRPPRAAPPP